MILDRFRVTGQAAVVTGAGRRVAGRGYLVYGTAKAALAHYTRLAAADLAPRIRVNAIAVGSVARSSRSTAASASPTSISGCRICERGAYASS